MSNKSVRLLLEMIYGKGCMFKKANIPERLEGTKIKGYKQFIEEQHYKLKKINQLERNLTLHHLKHQADGGETTIENGVVINELAHRYLHSLPRDEEEIINNMLREYKTSLEIKGGIIIPTEKELTVLDSFIEPFIENNEDFISIALEDITPEIQEKRFNRSKEKVKTQKLIEYGIKEYFEGDCRYE